MSEETELQRVCPVCGIAIPVALGFCPGCVFQRARSSEDGQATAKDSNAVETRFEHFQVVLRDGKPVELGRGGMGVTYKAIDTNLGTPVALKVINRAYLDSELMRQRFVAEAKAAAGLRHPNVASVFHLGKSGEDYFYAMELVEGEPLDRILRFRGPLETSLALEIADQLAAALSAAYKNGLVHRDIKPGNLMVVFGEQGKIAVKVIDFGLAQRLRLPDLFPNDHHPGAFCGTPQFASPEQCRGNEIDIRSDLYSVGITMWVMLSGKVPFQGSLCEVLQKQESEFPPFETLEHVPGPVVELLKCLLDKEPAKRPQTPLELQNRICALKTGLSNRVRRQRDRFKRWSLFGAGLLVITAGLSVLFFESQRHSEEQMSALQSKVDKLEKGVESYVDAQNKVRQQEASQKPDQLDRATYEELGRELQIDPVALEKQLPRFAEELKKSPKATSYERANDAYVGKDYNEAERLALVAADEAKSATPPKTSEAIKAFELAAWAADSRIGYADAMTHLREAERLTDRVRDPEEWARVQSAVAHELNHQGHYREEEPILVQVVNERERTLGPQHPDTLSARHRLAMALERESKHAEAETEGRAVLALREKVLGPEHPDTLNTRRNLALVLEHEGKYTEAENDYRAVLVLQDKLLGPEHPDTLITRDNLALALEEQGLYAKAEPEFRAVLALREKVLGPDHPETLKTRNNLALSLEEQGEYARAEAEYRALLAVAERVLGPEHPITLGARNDLGLVLNEQGKYADAETEFRSVLVRAEKVLGPENPDTLATRDDLAVAVEHQGKYADAERELRTVLSLEEKALGPQDPNTLQVRRDLAVDLYEEDKYAESETELRNVLAVMEKVNGDAHPETLQTCFDLALCLRAEKKTAEAKALAERAVEGAQKLLGIEHPDTKKYRQFLDSLQ
jgi:eukaryotic-like serine/threonine-protein kinase